MVSFSPGLAQSCTSSFATFDGGTWSSQDNTQNKCYNITTDDIPAAPKQQELEYQQQCHRQVPSLNADQHKDGATTTTQNTYCHHHTMRHTNPRTLYSMRHRLPCR